MLIQGSKIETSVKGRFISSKQLGLELSMDSEGITTLPVTAITSQLHSLPDRFYALKCHHFRYMLESVLLQKNHP